MQETPVLKQIMLALGCLPKLRIWRNNTGQLWSGSQIIKFDRGKTVYVEKGDVLLKNAYPVKFGLEGSADILGIIAPDGRFLAIEVKRPKGGRQSERQQNFEGMVKAMGGIYILARSPEEALEELNKIVGVTNGKI